MDEQETVSLLNQLSAIGSVSSVLGLCVLVVSGYRFLKTASDPERSVVRDIAWALVQVLILAAVMTFCFGLIIYYSEIFPAFLFWCLIILSAALVGFIVKVSCGTD